MQRDADDADVDYLLQFTVPDGRRPDENLTRNVSKPTSALDNSSVDFVFVCINMGIIETYIYIFAFS